MSRQAKTITRATRAKNTKFVFDKYTVSFSDKLAQQYKPIIYKYKCNSGSPKCLYYRIVLSEETKMSCIQYFYYWEDQRCYLPGASHRYDYEPIFIYLQGNESFPYRIVNAGLGSPYCKLHKNEIRPRTGIRQIVEGWFDTTLSPKKYFPWGKNGKVRYSGCSQVYPLSNGGDLQFQDRLHPCFGIRECSNVFSGAKNHLRGEIFDPRFEKLTDGVLEEWYFQHYSDRKDSPFGHDIADPFSSPYIKYHRPTQSEVQSYHKKKKRKYH
jgi:hypothetical protein